jgi:hypothetical protein
MISVAAWRAILVLSSRKLGVCRIIDRRILQDVKQCRGPASAVTLTASVRICFVPTGVPCVYIVGNQL